MHLYEISPTGGLTPQPYDPANWPPGDGLHWLDGAPAHPAELLPIVAPLRPHPLLLEDLIGPERTTLITRYDDLLYMEFPVSNGRASRSVPYLAILLSPTLLITVPYGAAPPLDALAQTLADRAGLGPGGLDELLIVILGHLIDGARQELLRLRDEVYATSDLLDEDVDAIALEDFAALRRQLGVLAIVAEDQHYCVTNLHPNASHLWTKEQPKVLLRDLINDTDYILRSSARLEQRLDGLHDQYQLALHDRHRNAPAPSDHHLGDHPAAEPDHRLLRHELPRSLPHPERAGPGNRAGPDPRRAYRPAGPVLAGGLV